MFGNTGPCLLASLVLGPLALAQESAAIFDAPNVALTQFMVSNPPFDRLLDIDGDNRMDAVGMSVWDDYDHTYLRIYQNDGAGKLSSIWSTIVTRPGVADAQPLAVGDFSGDGRADFAVGIGNAIHLFQVHGPAAPVATEIAELVIPGGRAGRPLAAGPRRRLARGCLCACHVRRSGAGRPVRLPELERGVELGAPGGSSVAAQRSQRSPRPRSTAARRSTSWRSATIRSTFCP